ncbi:MAG: MscL family protein, partial [Nostocoides sp.]
LAVAFVIGAAFATVITAFTAMFMDVLGKLGGSPDFSNWVPGGVHVGAFLTALVAFVIVAGAIYFFVVKPYEAYKANKGIVDPADAQITLLTEIRDTLQARR